MIATDGNEEAANDAVVGIAAALTDPNPARRFRCEAFKPTTANNGATNRVTTASSISTTEKPNNLVVQARDDQPRTLPQAVSGRASLADAPTGTATAAAAPLFSFELEVHGAAEWAGAAAAQAAVQVWVRLEEGGDRAAFQRLWEAMQQDVLRQNRRWRREMLRNSAVP